jgi:hypothetical protein
LQMLTGCLEMWLIENSCAIVQLPAFELHVMRYY